MLLPNNFIAENILNILKAKKISVKDLAADLKEPEYRILNWLNRKEEIPAYFIPYISEALQVSNDKILNKHKSYTGIEEHYIDYENPYDLLNHFIIDGLDDIFIYRGQNNDWLLQPSYCRFCNRNRILLDKLVLNCDACPLEDLFKEKILNRIKKECSVYDLSNKIKDFNNEALLAYMQHHNIPTPLLDWTISPLIALYFAIKDSYERDCITLYAFNLSEYDKTHPRYTDFNEIKPGISILQIPSENLREINQQSIFMFCWKCQDIESYFQTIFENTGIKYLKKYYFNINESCKIRLIKTLKNMNISERTLFPDLPYIAKDIMMEEFFLRLNSLLNEITR